MDKINCCGSGIAASARSSANAAAAAQASSKDDLSCIASLLLDSVQYSVTFNPWLSDVKDALETQKFIVRELYVWTAQGSALRLGIRSVLHWLKLKTAHSSWAMWLGSASFHHWWKACRLSVVAYAQTFFRWRQAY